jgi:hypothetical protein
METVAGDEGSAKFRQRRRGLAGAGLLPFPEGVDRFLHCLAWHVGISLDVGEAAEPDRLNSVGVPRLPPLKPIQGFTLPPIEGPRRSIASN